MLYNLSKLLDEHTEVSHGSSDSNLKINMENLEKEYLDATKQNVGIVFIFQNMKIYKKI